MKIKNAKDFWAGAMFVAFGLGFAIVARNYPMGSGVRMGPAYFPTVLGLLLAVLGLAILVHSFASAHTRVPPFKFRPLILVLIAIGLFGLLLKPLGLVLATFILVIVGALGGHEFRWRDVLILAAILAAFGVLVFNYGLSLPFNIWPAALG
ncbi:MAG: tripartite tricarboxylate transporter TctB family protein [Burkholderiales bacterium]